MTSSIRTIYEEKKRTRFKFKVALALVLLLGLAAGFAYLNWEERLFEFREVAIVGANSLSDADILGSERPISFFSSVRISHPAIAAATVSRDYFNRVLRIEISERERYGVWCAEPRPEGRAASCFWFDREGVLFSVAPRAEGSLVRRISDHTGRELLLGLPALEAERMGRILAAFELLARAGFHAEEMVIADLGKEETYADLLSGPRVIFSLRSDPTFAYEPLLSLKPELSKLEYIDLRVPQRIFLKYK